MIKGDVLISGVVLYYLSHVARTLHSVLIKEDVLRVGFYRVVV